MTKIICDTNIWYLIASGEINLNRNPINNLYYHHLTVGELLATNKWKKHPDKVRETIGSMFSQGNYNHSFMFPPFQYIRHLLDSSYSYDSNIINNMLDKLRLLTSFLEIPKETILDFTDKGEIAKDFFKSEAVKMNINSNTTEIKTFRKRHKEWYQKKYDNTEETRNTIIKNVNEGTSSIDMDLNFEWNKIELYESVMKETSKQLNMGAIMFTGNDWVDFLQLVYVQPGDKFWTNDTGNVTKAIITSGMKHYLYEESIILHQ